MINVICGGLDFDQREIEQLFMFYDDDDSGTLQFEEFCDLLSAIPLTDTIDRTVLSGKLSAIRALMHLPAAVASSLGTMQLEMAGRLLRRLQLQGMSSESAADFVQALS